MKKKEQESWIERHQKLIIGLFGFSAVAILGGIVLISTLQGYPPCWKDQMINGRCPNWPQNTITFNTSNIIYLDTSNSLDPIINYNAGIYVNQNQCNLLYPTGNFFFDGDIVKVCICKDENRTGRGLSCP